MSMKRPTKKTILIVLGAIAVVAVITAATLWYLNRSAVVPHSIRSQANFAIFYPQPSRQITIQKKTFKYDQSLGQVSYIVSFDGQQLTFAEQSSPDSFSADPTFYPAFIQKLDGYAAFSSVNGRVDLTRPAQVQTETGVMNAKGTLLFAKSSGDLSENNWKLLFNALTNTQPN
jgi:hypothetical protein